MNELPTSNFAVDDLTTGPSRALISTKLYPPRLRSNFIIRPRLLDVLNQDSDRRLTIICAPAGYGKSTLAAQWLTHAAIPSAWATLDAQDNNPWSFFKLIIAALHSIDGKFAVKSEALLAGRGADNASIIIHQLIQELSEATRSFVLVLDDYHVIKSSEIHQAIGLLLQQLPVALRLVFISRTEPPLPLARLRANGEISQIGPTDLLFTRPEALTFFQDFFELDLTPGDVDVVHAHTEGWVAALNLVGVAVRGLPRDRVRSFADGFAGSVPYVDQYLWEEALDNQPEILKTFLLKTSILDRFTAELCNAVTGADDGDALIQRCERDNLFIFALDESGRWYRYHRLFADVLRDRHVQIASTAEMDELHRRASQWLEEHGFVEDAIQHAIAGHVWDRAIRLLETTCAMLFVQDRIVELRTWLEGLPNQVMERCPRLAFWLAWAMGRAGRWVEGKQPLRIAEEAWAAPENRLGRGSILLWYATFALHSADNRRSLDYGHQALDMLADTQPIEYAMTLATMGIAFVNQGDPVNAERLFSELRMSADTGGYAWLRSIEMVHSAGALIQQGRLLEATVLCRRANRIVGEWPTEIWAQGGYCLLGEIYLEWNLLEDARRCLQRADDLAEMTRALPWRSRIRRTMAQLAWARGEDEIALDELEPAVGFAIQTGTQQEVRNLRAQQARFWLASGQIPLARRWADSCGLDPYLTPEYERQFEHLTFIRLLTQDGRPELALPMLNSLRQAAETSGRLGELVEIMILDALARKASDDASSALEALTRALELGAPGGFLRVFVNEGPVLAPLLRHAAVRGGHREYAQRILTVIDGEVAPARPDQSDVAETLSDRELEVLRLVSAGLANRDIGRRLFISEKTVKKHLSNILGKLQATNRTQAVDQARRMRLL